MSPLNIPLSDSSSDLTSFRWRTCLVLVPQYIFCRVQFQNRMVVWDIFGWDTVFQLCQNADFLIQHLFTVKIKELGHQSVIHIDFCIQFHDLHRLSNHFISPAISI